MLVKVREFRFARLLRLLGCMTLRERVELYQKIDIPVRKGTKDSVTRYL